MRFAPLAALALCSIATLGHARDGSLQLDWAEPVTGLAEIVVTFRAESGQPNLTLREDLPVGAQNLRLPLPPLPRATQSVQAGLVRDGRVTDQSALRPLEGSVGFEIEMTLYPDLAIDFADYFDCDSGQSARITYQSGGLRLSFDGEREEFQLQTEDGRRYLSAEGSALEFDDNRAIMSLQGTAEITCAPALFAPLLPLTAVAQDASWRIELARGTAVIEVPGLESEGVADGLGITAPRNGSVALRNDRLSLNLAETRCRTADAALSFPLRAQLVAQGLDITPDGCAGNPLDLLGGGAWRVLSLLGIPLDLASGGELTIELNNGRIAGRGTCNRYVGTARTETGRLEFRDFGTTRLACAANLRNIELRFLDALEAATGFDVSASGQLTLFAGPMPLLTAKRRAAP